MEMTNISYRSKICNYLSANKTEIIFLSIIGILFYWLNYFSVIGHDDWFYAMICNDADFFKHASGRLPIESLKDIIISQWNHYQYINGRFLIHFIVQLFVGIFGLRAFQVANTIMFVLLIKYLCRICIPIESRNKYIYYVITFFLFWFYMGLFNIGYAYISTIAWAVNYLWSATMFIYIIYVFYKYKDFCGHIPNYKKWSFFALALLCGASHEAFSVGLSATLFIYYIFNRKEYNGIVRYITIGLWIGAATIVFAPGNFIRFGETSDSGLIFALKLRLDQIGMKWIQLTPIIILIFLIIMVKIKQGIFKHIFNQYKILLYTVFVTFLFLFFIGMSGSEQMFSIIAIITVIFILKLIFSYEFVYRYKNLLFLSLILIFGIHYTYVLQYRQEEFENYSLSFNEYINSETGLVIYRPIDKNLVISAYGIGIMNFRILNHNFEGINQLYFNDTNKHAIFIPNLSKGITLYNKIEENDEYSIYNDEYFFIVKLTSPENEYEFYTGDYSFDSIMLRIWFKYLAQRPNKIKVYSDRIEYNNETYYIIRKKQQDKTIYNIKINEI